MTKHQYQEILDSIGAVRCDVATVAAVTQERFDKIDGRFTGVEARLDKIDDRLDKVDVRLDKVEGQLGQLDRKVDKYHVEVIAHIDRVHQQLSGRIGDLEQAWANPPASRSQKPA